MNRIAAVLYFVCCLALGCRGGEDVSPATGVAAAQLSAQVNGVAAGSFNPAARGISTPRNAKVMVIPVNDTDTTKYGMIDDWQANFIARRLRRAEDEKFDLVILEIDTNGGAVDSCEKINRALGKCKVPAVAYVTGKAFSGGAIISLGCRAIVMAPGTQIGGAKAVSLFGALDADMRQKVDSEMRAMVANLCDLNHYPRVIAQGMVDSNVEVLETNVPTQRFMTGEEFAHADPKPTIVKTWKNKDQILTLSANEARDVGIACGIAANLDELLLGLAVTPASIERADITAAEVAARFLGNPLWRVLLVLIGLVALVWELKSPGHGMGYLTFAFCLGLFFWLQIFSNNAGLFEIVLFGLGAVLVAFEIFILPTFGALGFAGLVMLVLSIVLAFFPTGSLENLWHNGPAQTQTWEWDQLISAMEYASLTLVLIIAAILTAWARGASLPVLRRLALQTESGGTTSSASVEMPAAFETRLKTALIGQTGVTETLLRPAGKVRVGETTCDAVTEGGFIEPGTPVVVVGVSGNGLIVRKA